MLHFEGDEAFPQTPTDLYARLSDARFLVQCLPDVESVSHAEAQSASGVLRPGFSFVRGTLEMHLQVVPLTPEKAIQVQVRTKGVGTTSAVEARLTFIPKDDGTQLHWVADVRELGGLLKAVPQGLLKAAAQKVIADVWKGVQNRLAS
jgi:carbon monoxide dehydrogenase subunit G